MVRHTPHPRDSAGRWSWSGAFHASSSKSEESPATREKKSRALSNWYSSSTGTHGRSRRCAVTFCPSSACSAASRADRRPSANPREFQSCCWAWCLLSSSSGQRWRGSSIVDAMTLRPARHAELIASRNEPRDRPTPSSAASAPATAVAGAQHADETSTPRKAGPAPAEAHPRFR